MNGEELWKVESRAGKKGNFQADVHLIYLVPYSTSSKVCAIFAFSAPPNF
jgi:hypothetical protein